MGNLTNEAILQHIQSGLPGTIISAQESYGMCTIEVQPEKIVSLFQFLYNHPEMAFQFLTDLCGIHYPDQAGKELGVVYHLHSLVNNLRLRIKSFVPKTNPQIDSVSAIFKSANWQERETYDFYGIEFIGHPNLIRILNVDEMTYFPLRKEYPLEDQHRTDKNDSYFGR
jgi:NADH-quinone oxidoreductase subunit C